MNALTKLKQLNELMGGLHSKEVWGKASNSELKRWCDKGSFMVNGKRPKWNEELPDEDFWQIILHPMSSMRITLWASDDRPDELTKDELKMLKAMADEDRFREAHKNDTKEEHPDMWMVDKG